MEPLDCSCFVCAECVAVDAPRPVEEVRPPVRTPLSAIVHHIRTPLAVLAANNSFLRDVSKPEPGGELSSVLHDNQLAIDAICELLDSLTRGAGH